MSTQRREQLIAQAVADRKITNEQAPRYRELYDATPGPIEHLLTAPIEQGGLMAGRVPSAPVVSERDAVIAAAVADRKIARSSAAQYQAWWDENPAGIRNLLTASVAAGGLAVGLLGAEVREALPTAYPAEWTGGQTEPSAAAPAAPGGTIGGDDIDHAPTPGTPTAAPPVAAGGELYPATWLAGHRPPDPNDPITTEDV